MNRPRFGRRDEPPPPLSCTRQPSSFFFWLTRFLYLFFSFFLTVSFFSIYSWLTLWWWTGRCWWWWKWWKSPTRSASPFFLRILGILGMILREIGRSRNRTVGSVVETCSEIMFPFFYRGFTGFFTGFHWRSFRRCQRFLDGVLEMLRMGFQFFFFFF